MNRNILLILLILIAYYCFTYNTENFGTGVNVKDKITNGLQIIDKIFNDNNIYYTIAYGTLLGAVRHWDMIPWDDDADINVMREDYYKILSLKDEFKKHGLIMKTDWKLIKIYFDKTEFPFIDIFINENIDGKIIRCHEPYDKQCTTLDRVNDWWWKWIDYPSDWIMKRKRYKFGSIELWGPKDAEKILKFWYGEKCLEQCTTPILDHVTGDEKEPENISCGNLPKPQL
jgi:hypothetical protein